MEVQIARYFYYTYVSGLLGCDCVCFGMTGDLLPWKRRGIVGILGFSREGKATVWPWPPPRPLVATTAVVDWVRPWQAGLGLLVQVVRQGAPQAACGESHGPRWPVFSCVCENVPCPCASSLCTRHSIRIKVSFGTFSDFYIIEVKAHNHESEKSNWVTAAPR